MTGGQRRLVLHAVLLIVLMFAAVPLLTGWLGGPRGWLASMALYWCAFCIPVIWVVLGPRGLRRLWTFRLGAGERWVPLVLLAQVAMVAAGSLTMLDGPPLAAAVALAVLVALVNAPLEEAAWRGGFLHAFGANRMRGFWLGLALFAAWHVPLGMAQGIVNPGGTAALVGGAAFLGLVWSVVAWRTGSIAWVTVAHFATNIFAFTALFSSNGFV